MRVILFTGKGGVGKTSVAAATAVQCARAGYRKRTSSGKARAALIRKALLYDPAYGTVDFTVPHFADFMRRRYPLASLLKADDVDAAEAD